MKGYVSKRYLSEKFDVLKRELYVLTLGYDDEVEQRNLERAGATALEALEAMTKEIQKGME